MNKPSSPSVEIVFQARRGERVDPQVVDAIVAATVRALLASEQSAVSQT